MEHGYRFAIVFTIASEGAAIVVNIRSSSRFTEQIFRIPGIGSLLITAILANDTPVIMAVTFVFACLVVVFNLLADIIYGWLDPRISYR